MEQSFLLIFCLQFLIVYLSFLGFAIFNWVKNNQKYKGDPSLLSVSIVVCARNEEFTLPDLIESFNKVSYPSHLLEIIIVNDQSEDNTGLVLQKLKKQYNLNIKILNTTILSVTPKKDALNIGVKNAAGDILLFTDADCIVHFNWVEQLTRSFSNKQIDLVFGPVKYSESGYLEKFLSLEQAALLGSAFASLKMRIPTMCNGANMAVRRTSFNNIYGFNSDSQVASGDDELLLHKVYKSDPKSVAFIKSSDAVVTTKPVENFKQLFNQRKRWAGKWEKYLFKRTKIFALSIFCFHLSWILLFGLSVFNNQLLPNFIVFFLAKAFFEYVFIFLVMKFLDKKINLSAFVFLQFVYSFYVVFFGLVSRGTSYQWKDRKLY